MGGWVGGWVFQAQQLLYIWWVIDLEASGRWGGEFRVRTGLLTPSGRAKVAWGKAEVTASVPT